MLGVCGCCIEGRLSLGFRGERDAEGGAGGEVEGEEGLAGGGGAEEEGDVASGKARGPEPGGGLWLHAGEVDEDGLTVGHVAPPLGCGEW